MKFTRTTIALFLSVILSMVSIWASRAQDTDNYYANLIAFTGTDNRGNEDIYVVDVNSDYFARLTDHPAEDSWPRWSPDGENLAFLSGRVAVEGDTDLELFIMHKDGSNMLQLTDNNVNEGLIGWSPDGQWIAYSTSDANENLHGVWIVHPDGTEAHQLTEGSDAEIGMVWLPDSSGLAYAEPENVVQGFDLTGHPIEAEIPTSLFLEMAPDGITALRIETNENSALPQNRIVTYNLDNPDEVTELHVSSCSLGYAIWSPTAERIAYVSNCPLDQSNDHEVRLEVIDLFAVGETNELIQILAVICPQRLGQLE